MSVSCPRPRRRVRSDDPFPFLAALLAVAVLAGSLLGGPPATASTVPAAAAQESGSPYRAPGQPLDETYTARIREDTTEPFFLTPLVDHLPDSGVPTPLDVLGHISGARDVLSYPEEIYRYMRAVDEASDRVEVLSIGDTEEGREMILVVVADEETIANIDGYKARIARLADPRRTSEAEAAELVRSAKPMYWATGAIHSPETGSPEMLMELVYRLAVEDSEFVRAIRDNLIFMATPVVEVDGRAKVVDLHMARRKDPDASTPTRPLYWGKYVAHDNNRDGMSLSLKLQQNVTRTFLEWQPTVFHDLHESASHLYTSTGRGPYNAWIDPIVINEWSRLAYKEVQDMTAFGVPGVYTHDYYDGWAPNYMFWVANMRNSIGRFYETQGAGDGSTRVLRTNVEREWHRPSTPLPEVMWSIRNNVNMQQSALLIALHEVATHREEYLRNFWLKSKRSVAKAATEGPAAYVFPGDDPRPGQQARTLQLLQRHGIEVHRADAAFSAAGRDFEAGSYVVRMDQPFSRAADMLLDTQYYNPDDPRPYDDTGWTVGPLHNTETVRVEDDAVLDAPMTPVSGMVRAAGGVEASGAAAAFVIDYNADNNLAAFRFAHADLAIEAAERRFSAAGRDFNPGSFILRSAGNLGNLAELLGEAGREYGFTARAVAAVPDVPTHDVRVPRVAIMHTWQNTQTEGWIRVGFDEYGVPYDYISVHEARDEPDLRSKYDVIVFGPSGDPLGVVRGVQGDEPIPWNSTELTPNIGYVDSTDDMRGGLGLQGVVNLERFVDDGGVFITLTSSSELPIHFGLAEGVSVRQLDDLWAPGGVFRAVLADANSPLAYGYGPEVGVYFNRGPVFQAGGFGGGRGFGRGGFGGGGSEGGAGDTTERRSGRGAIGEEDIVQGRPRDMGQAGVEAWRREQGEPEGPGGRGGRGGRGGFGGGGEDGPRVVFRFPSEARQVLISGGLVGAARLTDAPLLVDAPRGNGHVVMFGFNPFWRSETLGSYAMVFNALMHWDSLDAGSRSSQRLTEEQR